MSVYDERSEGGASGGGEGEKRGPRCALCGKSVDPAVKPFCSRRCADIDLHRWLAGAYRVPTEETADEERGSDTPSGPAGRER